MVLLTPLGPISLVDVCVWVSVAICVIVGVVSACTHVALEVPSTSRGQSYHTPRLCTGYLLLCNWGAPAYISVSNDYLIHIVLTGICYQLFILCVFSTRTHTRSRAGVWENPESPTRSAWAQAEVAAQPPVQPLSKVKISYMCPRFKKKIYIYIISYRVTLTIKYEVCVFFS